MDDSSKTEIRPVFIIVGVLAMFIVAGLLFIVLEKPAGNSVAGPTAPATTTPGLGHPAADGQFTFVASAYRCNIPSVGVDGYGGGVRAQGQFCAFNLRIVNHSNSAQTFDVSAQFAYDNEGRKFTASTDADTWGNTGTGMDFQAINPGNSISGTLYFDVPKGDQIVQLELHDSLFSDGVTVNV